VGDAIHGIADGLRNAAKGIKDLAR
jgi:hypothetical protein